jgi:hypothetical protein
MYILPAVFDAAALVTVAVFAPIKHPRKEISEAMRKKYRHIGLIITLTFSVINVMLCGCMRMEGLIISITLLVITCMMYMGLWANARGGKNDENRR